MTFGEWLEHLRRERNLSRADLATRAGLSPQAIHFLETGARAPLLETCRKLAVALGVSMDTLITLPPTPITTPTDAPVSVAA